MGHAMIMGRKTYESIGRPLPGRRNIILTRQQGYEAPGCQVCASLEESLAICSQEEKVFIIGGGGPFRDGLALAHTLILTVIDEQIEGDTWFPEFSLDEFPLVASHSVEGSRPYTINTHKRITGP